MCGQKVIVSKLPRKRARADPNQREHNVCRFGSGGRGRVVERERLEKW